MVVRLFLHAARRLLRAAAAARPDGHRRRRQGAAVAVHRDLRDAAGGAAALRRAGGAIAARALHSRRLSLLRRQSRAVLAAADARHRAGDRSRACSSSGSACSTCSRSRCSGRSWPTCSRSEQGKRLFGFIGAGGTAGALLGPVITIAPVGAAGPGQPADRRRVLLELAVFCVHRLERSASAPARAAPPPTSASAAAPSPRCRELLRSPYLLGVGAWVSLLSFGATILYFEQAHIVSRTRARRRRADAHFRQHRPRGRAADPGDAGVRHRPRCSSASAPAWRRRALPAVYVVGLRRAGARRRASLVVMASR